MGGLVVLALVVVPLVEIYVLVQVGQVIGALPTVLLLLAMSLLGGYLLRREGARTWSAFRAALEARGFIVEGSGNSLRVRRAGE